MRAAPGRDRDLRQPQSPSLGHQRRPQIQVTRRVPAWTDPGAAPRGPRRLEATQDFRTYFIAVRANANTTMHYDFHWLRRSLPLQQLDAALQDTGRRAAPPRVQQRDRPPVRYREVNGDAIGDRDDDEQAGRSRSMAVDAVEDQPGVARPLRAPRAPLAVPGHGGPVHLVRQDERGKRRPKRRAEAAPAGRDAGDDAIAVGPFAELDAGHRWIADGLLAKHRRDGKGGRDGRDGTEIGHAAPSLPPLPPLPSPSIRSICAPSARSRSSIRS